jgi:hypothetical protein
MARLGVLASRRLMATSGVSAIFLRRARAARLVGVSDIFGAWLSLRFPSAIRDTVCSASWVCSRFGDILSCFRLGDFIAVLVDGILKVDGRTV